MKDTPINKLIVKKSKVDLINNLKPNIKLILSKLFSCFVDFCNSLIVCDCVLISLIDYSSKFMGFN